MLAERGRSRMGLPTKPAWLLHLREFGGLEAKTNHLIRLQDVVRLVRGKLVFCDVRTASRHIGRNVPLDTLKRLVRTVGDGDLEGRRIATRRRIVVHGNADLGVGVKVCRSGGGTIPDSSIVDPDSKEDQCSGPTQDLERRFRMAIDKENKNQKNSGRKYPHYPLPPTCRGGLSLILPIYCSNVTLLWVWGCGGVSVMTRFSIR